MTEKNRALLEKCPESVSQGVRRTTFCGENSVIIPFPQLTPAERWRKRCEDPFYDWDPEVIAAYERLAANGVFMMATPQPSLGKWGINYVEARGIDPSFACMLGIDETQADPQIIIKRCNFGSAPEQIKSAFKDVTSLVWFPLIHDNGDVSYIARINGLYLNSNSEAVKFLYSKNGRRAPWIPGPVRALAKDTDKEIIIGEGFFKMASVHRADVPFIAFSGVWINESVPPAEKDKLNNRVLIRELDSWRWRSRRVLFAFDGDQSSNDDVRRAVIRAWILFKVVGAEVFQLEWDPQNTGIDDYLARQCGTDRLKQKALLEQLKATAVPFVDCLVKGAGGDARLVRQELRRVKMDVTDREAFAKEVAGRLGVTKDSLLKADGAGAGQNSRRVMFEDLEPWDQPVDGNLLLGELIALLDKHLFLHTGDATTIALWIIFTYLVSEGYVQVSPYLALCSPVKRCGKTRLLELIERLIWRGYLVGDISKAGFFRLIEKFHPSLLIDEAHKILENRRELLQLFLDAYSRSKPVMIINQDTHEPEQFDIWCARGLAFIGGIDDQLFDRCIEVKMERKRAADPRPRPQETPKSHTLELRRKILRWVRDNADAIGQAVVPALKSGNDRAQDNWEMLFRIAAVIDPSGVDAVVQIARTKEIARGDLQADEDIVLQGVQQAYRDACQCVGKDYDLAATDIFLSLPTICTLLNTEDPKMGPWHIWKRGQQYGANEYKLSKIVRAFTQQKECDRSRKEPNLSGLIATWQVSASDVQGFWLSTLRPMFEAYK